MRASPFELPWGSSVYAKVIATNIFGNSMPSEAGFGAVIMTKPDKPVDIKEKQSMRTDSVTVKVSATNAYGTSDYSADGVGALIQYPPDAPLQLANDASVTSATKIKLLWVDGVENGGTTVIDYKIMYD